MNNKGLRQCILDFFAQTECKGYDFLGKIDNDCVFPENSLEIILKKFIETDIDILSPNVLPSNAAYNTGQDDIDNKGYRKSTHVGGLWFMKDDFARNLFVEELPVKGFTGAFALLKQIVNFRDPNVGWITDFDVQDIGHWSGKHEEHIKTEEHREYYEEVGRRQGW